jgi:hypothetical protein
VRRLGDLRLQEHLPASPHRFRETVLVGDGIERGAPALGERRPQRFFRDTAIVGRADRRKRRCEQLLAHHVARSEATVEIEGDRFGHWAGGVAWRQCHVVEFSRIPSSDHQPARAWTAANIIDAFRDLVD